VWVEYVTPRLDSVHKVVLTDTGEARVPHPVHSFVFSEVVTGPVVNVTAVVRTIGEKCVTELVLNTVIEVFVINVMGIVTMDVHRDGTG
jgi:hypothetical protein